MNKVMLNKEEIDDAIFYQDYKEKKEDIEKSKKLKEIKHEDFRYLPDYFVKEKSIEKVRLAYRFRSKMVNDIKSNFKNSHKEGLQCDW